MNANLRSALIVLALIATSCRHDEPMAGGKPLSYWKKEATQVSWMSFWNSQKDERRGVAFRQLAEIGEPAVPVLVDLFRTHEVPVSSDAFNVLVNLGPRASGAVPDLVEILNGDDTPRRIQAAWILGAIGQAAEPAVPALTVMLQHPDARLRDMAARALAQIGGTGKGALDRAWRSDDARQRAASLRGIADGRLDPAARRDAVATGLADADPEVRVRSVELLMPLPPAEAERLVGYLVQALRDSDGRVNDSAHSVLRAYMQGGRATVPLLVAVLEGGDAAARADAAWHLGNRMVRAAMTGSATRDSSILTALLGALDDEDPKVRIYAGRALVYADRDPRERAIEQLRRDIPAVEPILAVRAARAIWDATHDPEDVKRVYEAGLADPEKWNRIETLSAIAHMGKDAETLVPLIERLLRDPDPEVRGRAETTLDVIRRQRS